MGGVLLFAGIMPGRPDSNRYHRSDRNRNWCGAGPQHPRHPPSPGKGNAEALAVNEMRARKTIIPVHILGQGLSRSPHSRCGEDWAPGQIR